MQFDETWGFVGNKPKHCDPDDRTHGDCWDHVAMDPETRLVVSLVVDQRTEDATHALVKDFHRRTGGRVMRLMTSDEYPVYGSAIRVAYGQVSTLRPCRRHEAMTVRTRSTNRLPATASGGIGATVVAPHMVEYRSRWHRYSTMCGRITGISCT